jgi:hypothetical protein
MESPSKRRNFIHQAFEVSPGSGAHPAPMDLIDRQIVAEL